MQKRELYVVGDRFKGFCVNENIMALSDFMTAISIKDQVLMKSKVKVGQGLSSAAINMLGDAIADSGLSADIDFQRPALNLMDKKHVHKHKEWNILLSEPEKVTETLYAADLLIDERCADISDHMTGQHIQGMVLTEAARQMFIGTTEAHLVDPTLEGKMTYIFNKIDIDFINFAFPLPITVEYEILDSEQKKNNAVYYRSEVRFFQNDSKLAVARVEFTNYESAFINALEANKARQTIAEAVLAEPDPIMVAIPSSN